MNCTQKLGWKSLPENSSLFQVALVSHCEWSKQFAWSVRSTPMNTYPGKQKVVVVMPAYNAAQTIEKTFADIPLGSVDEIILVDDESSDQTVAISKELNISVFSA